MSGFGSARLPVFPNHRFGTDEDSLTQAPRDILTTHSVLHTINRRVVGVGVMVQTCCCTRVANYIRCGLITNTISATIFPPHLVVT